MEPSADKKNGRIYTPFTSTRPHFTHQARRGRGLLPHLKVRAVPFEPGDRVGPADLRRERAARAALKFYGEERWGRERLDKEIGLAAAWARKHNVPRVCNEFGVYRAYAHEADRLRWLADVRATLEK